MSEAVADVVATTPETPATTTPAPEPAPAETKPTEAAAPPVEGKPAEEPAKVEEKKEEASGKEFLALKREKAKVFQKEQALKAKEQQIDQAMSDIVAPVRDVLGKIDDHPLGIIEFASKATGKSVQELFDLIVVAASKHGDPPDPNDRVSKLEKQIAERDAAAKAEREAQEAKLAEQAEAAMRDDMSSRLGTYISAHAEQYESLNLWSDYYELPTPDGIKVLRGAEAARQVHNDLMDLAEAWHTHNKDRTKSTLTVDEAAELLEAQYSEQDEARLTNRILKSKKLSRHYAPPAPTPAPAASPPAQAAAPPTNAAASAPAGDTTNEAPSPRHIPARRAVPLAGARAVRRSSVDEEQEWLERMGKSVRFTNS